MKVVRIILLVIAVVIITPLLIALFVPKDYAIVEEITINKPRQEVFNYIKLLKNQERYSVWVMADPKMKLDYTGTDGTVGCSVAWDSQQDTVGKGEQHIVKLADGERMDVDIHFYKPFPGDAKAYFATSDAAQGQTKVQWGFSSSMAYPMNLFLVLGMKEKLAKDLDKGLANLKINLESGK